MIFNSVLSAELQNLETSPEINIFTLDIFSLSLQIFANPTTFGFTNTTDTARIGIGGPPDVSTPGTDVVPNPEAYIFFDDIHPTTAWHSIVGNKAVEAVPEPTTLLLVAFGLIGLVGFRRKFKKK
jgi:phospholipase/lecithinase/hemolysin